MILKRQLKSNKTQSKYTLKAPKKWHRGYFFCGKSTENWPDFLLQEKKESFIKEKREV